MEKPTQARVTKVQDGGLVVSTTKGVRTYAYGANLVRHLVPAGATLRHASAVAATDGLVVVLTLVAAGRELNATVVYPCRANGIYDSSRTLQLVEQASDVRGIPCWPLPVVAKAIEEHRRSNVRRLMLAAKAERARRKSQPVRTARMLRRGELP